MTNVEVLLNIAVKYGACVKGDAIAYLQAYRNRKARHEPFTQWAIREGLFTTEQCNSLMRLARNSVVFACNVCYWEGIGQAIRQIGADVMCPVCNSSKIKISSYNQSPTKERASDSMGLQWDIEVDQNGDVHTKRIEKN